MSLTLHTMTGATRKRSKRVGRGNASGRGTYSGQGQKGQRARSGGRKGLQQRALRALFQRLPKQGGFTSLKPKAAVVTLGALQRHFSTGALVTPKALVAKWLVPRTAEEVKILNTGTISRALTISGCKLSAAAKEKNVAAGGTVVE